MNAEQQVANLRDLLYRLASATSRHLVSSEGDTELKTLLLEVQRTLMAGRSG